MESFTMTGGGTGRASLVVAVNVVRTWKSDRTQNVMDLDAAVANIMHACYAAYPKFERFALEKDVRRRLCHGEAVETPRAVFAVEKNGRPDTW